LGEWLRGACARVWESSTERKLAALLLRLCPERVSARSFSSAMLTMFNFVYTGENFGDVIFTDSTSGLSTVVFVIVSFLGNLVVLSQLVGSFQNYYGVASEKAAKAAEAKQRAKRRQGYLCVYAQLSVSFIERPL
jgi:hypothetical protein